VGKADDLYEWLLDGVPGATSAEFIVDRIATALVADGIPISRLHVFVKTLHPTVLGRQFRWIDGALAPTSELTIELQQAAAFQQSPLSAISISREVRRNLERELAPDDYAVLHDLRAAGFTEYVCLPLRFISGEVHAITLATRQRGGFTDDHIGTFRRITRPLQLVTEIWALRRVATNLLDTYVGWHSGERIMRGRILRGDLETMRAVIWFSDLRGFTAMSANLEPRATVAVLNELFEFQVSAIEGHGGEVLKFIGDGLLAIFPLAEGEDPAARCQAAISAGNEAFAALDKRNASAAEPLRYGLALHIGEIAYGNIGGASRLDFTAIGAAVNLASRLEGLTGKLGHRMLLSAELAAHASVPLDDLGEFELKGVATPQRVFAPRG